MKKIIIGLIIVFMCSVSYADNWYIVRESDYVVVAKQNGPANESAINADGYFSIRTTADFELGEAEYRNGKIVKRTVTQAEIDEAQRILEESQELQLIEDKLRDIAIDALEEEGVIFKHIKKKDK